MQLYTKQKPIDQIGKIYSWLGIYHCFRCNAIKRVRIGGKVGSVAKVITQPHFYFFKIDRCDGYMTQQTDEIVFLVWIIRLV